MQEQHGNHGGHDHTGHEQMFRHRFWICLVLSIPVLLYSPTLQEWLNFSMPVFPGSRWITPVLSVIIFIYGGIPFLRKCGGDQAGGHRTGDLLSPYQQIRLSP